MIKEKQLIVSNNIFNASKSHEWDWIPKTVLECAIAPERKVAFSGTF